MRLTWENPLPAAWQASRLSRSNCAPRVTTSDAAQIDFVLTECSLLVKRIYTVCLKIRLHNSKHEGAFLRRSVRYSLAPNAA